MSRNDKTEHDALEQLRKAIEALRKQGGDASDRVRKKLRTQIEALSRDLGEIAIGHDPIERPTSVFDPTDPKIASRLVAVALVAQPRLKLAGMSPFYGSGVYAIYYLGSEAAYKPISRTEHPIYVGVASPKHKHARTPVEQEIKLFSRLQEHAKSISNAPSLSIDDFECRRLVVATGWEGAAETHLINLFKPIWNREVGVCYGIGKHGDAATTRVNRRSPWDTMHPGRGWAKATREDQRSKTEIEAKISSHFDRYPPYKTTEEILLHLLQDMKQNISNR